MSTAPSPVEPAPMNAVARLFNVFLEPRATYDELYAAYRQVYRSLRGLYHSLNRPKGQ